MEFGAEWSVNAVGVEFDRIEVSADGLAELGVGPGAFLLAAGPRKLVDEALTGGLVGETAVRLELDVGSTKTSWPGRGWRGRAWRRVVEVRPSMHFDADELARVHREIDYQKPDIVVVRGAHPSREDDLRWAAAISHLIDTPTIAAFATDEHTGPAAGDHVRLFAAGPRAGATAGVENEGIVITGGEFGGGALAVGGETQVRGGTPERVDAAPIGPPGRPGPAPRYVNTVVRRVADGAAVQPGQPLEPGADHLLGIGIGPRRPDSLLTGDASFPDDVLPRRGRRLEVFVQPADRAGEDPQRGYLYLPESGPAFACPDADRLPDDTDWATLPHTACLAGHAELLDFAVPRRATPGLVALEAVIYAGAAAVHVQRVELWIGAGTGATARTTFRLLHDFAELPDLADRVASLVEGPEHLTVNGLGRGAFGFALRDAQWNGASVDFRTALTDLYFTQTRDGYEAKYPKGISREVYRAALLRLAAAGCSLFNGLFPGADSRDLAPLLASEAAARGRPAVIQIARTAQRPFVVPWQAVYDLPMEHPEDDPWVCPSVDEYGPGGTGVWPPPVSCRHAAGHEAAAAARDGAQLLCPYGFWGFAHHLEVPEPPPKHRALDQVVTTAAPAVAVLAGAGARLNGKALAAHLATLRRDVPGFPAADGDVVREWSGLRDALGPADMDVVYLLGHCRNLGEGGRASALEFPAGRSLTSDDVAAWTRRNVWPRDHWDGRRPLVVLNACHTAETVQSTLRGFVSNFVAAGAAGVVGTETLLDQGTASTAMELFLAEFGAGATVAEAIRLTRWRLLGRGNLLGLSYTPYCAAGLRLRPARDPRSNS